MRRGRAERRPSKHYGCCGAPRTGGANEGHGRPVAMRYRVAAALAVLGLAVAASHLNRRTCCVEEFLPLLYRGRLPRDLRLAATRHVSSLCRRKEPPRRAVQGARAPAPHALQPRPAICPAAPPLVGGDID